jgi:NIMA (never in mitosis gene a)-related kinase
VVAYKEAFFDEQDKCLYVVMEYAEKGDLLKAIALRRDLRQRFPEEEVWRAAGMLLSGLQELHRHKIIHRDLKSANVFIAKHGYQLGDFNVSKVLKEGMAVTQTGTPYYASPEIWRELPYNEKSDIWSLGCILYEMCALRPPFVASSMADLAQKVTRGKIDALSKRYSRDLEAFISSMIKVNPAARPSISTLL